MPRPELELLSPARDADIGIQAINHGADAVYIGGPAFGARANAGNSVADLERLVAYAHRFHARIFVTFNTILRDDELEPAQALINALYNIGADALIVQDMGLLALDLPPIQLHASTQTDIRTPQKARFLQDVGFSQMVLARELSLPEIRAVAAQVQNATLEFFIHGALCVAYSGQCYLSHAQTGRSANRGDCSQPCRLPYTVSDAQGRIVAHDSHVLSMKDNDQSANLGALVDAGIRSFKIEGRYKDMGYVKNVTAHYRKRLDALLEKRPELSAASSGRTTFLFSPDPARNFNRGATDYFVNGRLDDIGAFDSPKHAGLPLGHVIALTHDQFHVQLDAGVAPLNNGDALTYFDRQQQLVGIQVNTATLLDADQHLWSVEPNERLVDYPDLRRGLALARNRDMAWNRALDRKSADRRIAVQWVLTEAAGVCTLHLSDADGHHVRVAEPAALASAEHAERAALSLREALLKLGNTAFASSASDVALRWHTPRFVPASVANAWRRAAVDALEAQRNAAFVRLPRAAAVSPPVAYPEDTLSYLGNVFNAAAHRFYLRHGVRVIEAAYEHHQETGEVSLMITKHCVRFSLSLCPKQAKGVVGVQGTVRAEPMSMVHGNETLQLRFDCKACEMHVVGTMRPQVARTAQAADAAQAMQTVQAMRTPAGADSIHPLTFHSFKHNEHP